jgi:hypothetical protein
LIAPQGEVYLCVVPWTNNYAHVWYEGMRSPTSIVSQFQTSATTGYTFLRESQEIRVPYNADDIYGTNYVAYRNSGKWFFAFVDTITYVNNSTSTLHLTEDVWHTWGEYVSVRPCMVRREHVTTDQPGQWRAPEPNLSLESVTLTVQEFSAMTYSAIVVGTNAIPHLKANQTTDMFSPHTEDDFLGSDPVEGDLYTYIYSGARYYGFHSTETYALQNFLRNMNLCGAAESVCALFMVPYQMMIVNANHEITGYGMSVAGGFNAPNYIANGYVPRNKKCLTYPYAYATMTDFAGSEMDIKYEDCNTWGQVRYRFSQGLDPTAALFVTMTDYMGQTDDPSHSMPIAQNPQCAWTYNGYQNWMAQNSASLQTKQNVGAGEALLGAGAILGGAILAFTPIGPATSEFVPGSLVSTGLGMLAGGLRERTDVALQIEAQSKVPAHIIGTPSGNSLQGIGRNEGGFVAKGLSFDSAQRLDQYFDVLGYEVDLVKVPNLTGRPSWNYVRTEGAACKGTIPADRLAVMDACLDRGMTFWHTSDVGNYALSNGV